jgi:hypothetical protein
MRTAATNKSTETAIIAHAPATGSAVIFGFAAIVT